MKHFILLIFVILFSAFIWYLGPYLILFNHHPLASISHRIFIIGVVIFSWLMSYLKYAPAAKINRHIQHIDIILAQLIPQSNLTNKKLAKTPCYVVIGPHNSGKSSLLLNQQALKIHAFSQNQDDWLRWWITDKACFLEINSDADIDELLTNPEFWHDLEQHVINKRLQRNIDAYLVVDNVNALQLGNLKHIVSAAQIDETPIPMYLCLTHWDQLNGFQEFFSHLNEQQQQHLWGIKLNESFNTQFDVLLQHLNQQTINIAHQQNNKSNKARIIDFPRQVEMMKQTLQAAIEAFIDDESVELKTVSFASNRPTAFFVSAIFQDMLLSDNPIPKTQHVAERRSLLRFGITSACLLIVGAGVLLYHYRHQLNLIQQIESTITSYKKLANQPTHPQTIKPSLSLLKRIQATQQSLGKQHAKLNTSLSKLKYHTKQRINATIHTSITPQIQLMFDTAIFNNLNNKPQALLSALKMYLLLGKPNRTASENEEILTWISQHNPSQSIQPLLPALIHNSHFTILINQGLVQTAQSKIASLPLPQLVLTMIREEKTDAVMSFGNIASIPLLYTKQHLSSIFTHDIPNACQKLATNNGQDCINNTRAYYLGQYATIWKQALANITLSRFNNLQQASDQLNSMTKPNSDFIQLINAIRSNTTPIYHMPEFNHLVSNQFQAIDTIAANNHHPLLIQLIQQLNNYLQAITSSPNSQAKAYQVAAQRMNRVGNDQLFQIQQQSSQLPPLMQQWMKKLTQNIWGLILTNAKDYINRIWVVSVYPQYLSTINHRYPIFKRTNRDVSMQHFIQFFGPNGIMERFTNAYLKPFINTNQFYWTLKSVDNQTLPISKASLEMFMRAALITKMYFPNQESKPLIRFSLTPEIIKPGIKQVTLLIDGQRANFNPASRTSAHFTWPMTRTHQASAEFINADTQKRSLSESGPWAWFKLLDRSIIQTTNNVRRFEITFKVEGETATFALLTQHVVSPFLPNITNKFRCPRQL